MTPEEKETASLAVEKIGENNLSLECLGDEELRILIKMLKEFELTWRTN